MKGLILRKDSAARLDVGSMAARRLGSAGLGSTARLGGTAARRQLDGEPLNSLKTEGAVRQPNENPALWLSGGKKLFEEL